jgi:cytochrome b involved in lipid metabolism
LELGGKDGTEPFEEIGHSADARMLLEKYHVGDLDPKVEIH